MTLWACAPLFLLLFPCSAKTAKIDQGPELASEQVGVCGNQGVAYFGGPQLRVLY